jgi:hypothetical protein
MSTLPLFDNPMPTPLQRKEVGMEKVARHAEQISPEWLKRCRQILIIFADERSLRSKPFLTEEFRKHAKASGLDEIHDDRAYGIVIRDAAKDGLIKSAGYRTDQYCSPKTQWEKA